MYGRWQVQTLVEPINLGRPESVHPEIVQPPTDTPMRNFAFSRLVAGALIAAAPTFMPIDTKAITQPERSTPDKWQADTNRPYPYRTKPVAEGWVAIDAKLLTQPERTTPDKWQPASNNPYLTLKYPVRTGWTINDPAAMTQPEHTSQDKWAQPQSQPYPYRGKPFHNGWTVNDPFALTQTERASIDKWWRQLSEPRRDVERRQWAYPSFSADAQLFNVPGVEIILADKWRPQPNQPYLTLRYPVREGVSIIDPQQLTLSESILLDKWVQRQNEPRRDIERRQWIYPAFSADTQLFNVPGVEVIRADKWHPAANQPYLILRYPVRVGASVIDTVQLTQTERVSFDKWYYQPSEPQRDAKRQQFLYPSFTADAQLFVQPGVEVIRIDKWGPASNQPYRVLQFPVRTGISVIDPRLLTQAERVSFDKWHYQQSLPRFDVRRAQFEYPTLAIDARTIGTIDLDQWEPRLNEPYPYRPVLKANGWTVVDPRALTQKEAVSFDRWHYQQSEPRRDVQRNQYYYLVFATDTQSYLVPLLSHRDLTLAARDFDLTLALRSPGLTLMARSKDLHLLLRNPALTLEQRAFLLTLLGRITND